MYTEKSEWKMTASSRDLDGRAARGDNPKANGRDGEEIRDEAKMLQIRMQMSRVKRKECDKDGWRWMLFIYPAGAIVTDRPLLKNGLSHWSACLD